MAESTQGNCYLCGGEYGKAAMKTHLLKHAPAPGEQQACYLLRVEGARDKNYWLYLDVPLTAPLSAVDGFLRKIWLECCGHLSAFFGPGRGDIGKGRKLAFFSVGDKLRHEYDFGSTTETVITIVGETVREKQRTHCRLLARNVPPDFRCAGCGAPATALCAACAWEGGNPFLCDACGERHEHDDMLLPVVNSPRMGECGYCGELDAYAFRPEDYAT